LTRAVAKQRNELCNRPEDEALTGQRAEQAATRQKKGLEDYRFLSCNEKACQKNQRDYALSMSQPARGPKAALYDPTVKDRASVVFFSSLLLFLFLLFL
jgi:hypothetical protein